MSISRKQQFESLYSSYHQMVVQMCMGFMKGEDELANDLSQEIFINIWNALPAFRGDSSHKTWIYRITVNTCLQQIRKDKKKQQVSLGDVDQRPDLSASAPMDSHYRELYSAIGQLNEIDRLVIMMVLDELEYDEISRITGINPVNLRVKIHRIKLRLKKILSHE